jgi:hypothetical protein
MYIYVVDAFQYLTTIVSCHRSCVDIDEIEPRLLCCVDINLTRLVPNSSGILLPMVQYTCERMCHTHNKQQRTIPRQGRRQRNVVT